MLRPTAGSAIPSWQTAAGAEVAFPAGDSHCLPERVDRTATNNLNLVDAVTAGGLGEGQAYSVDLMDRAIERALANRGALGMYCNRLMVNKAIFDRLPETPVPHWRRSSTAQ